MNMNDLDLMNKDRFDDGENVFNFTIHIRLKKRNNKKTITTVEGIPEEFDFQKILRFWKKSFNCTGSVVIENSNEDSLQTVISLTGDHRTEISRFLIEEGIAMRDNIKVHGF